MNYLDHAATTPIRESAADAWANHSQIVGNPSSIHGAGREARRIVEDSRETIAEILGVHPTDVIFTSGGTEANNMAILGMARAQREDNPNRNQILVSPVEHHSVLDAAYWLVNDGFSVLDLVVRSDGSVDYDSTTDLVDRHHSSLALGSCMWVNNEIGTITDIPSIGDLFGSRSIPFHCDAIQAGSLLVHGSRCPGSFSISAHKVGGPMGIGALILPRGTKLTPISFGGGQEKKLRSGTIPVALVAGFAQALVEARTQAEVEYSRITHLATRLRQILLDVGAQVVPNHGDTGPQIPFAMGVDAKDCELRSGFGATGGTQLHNCGKVTEESGSFWEKKEHGSHHSSITYALFEGCRGQDLVQLLDAQGIFVSTGAACTAGIPQPSHVLLALGYTEVQALTGLRFSLGWPTTDEDLDALADGLPKALTQARTL
ncbi:MAG: cysteine desulfurase [Propionibacteriaceae bacterium]|nr:cysteine desulfurase [Propionibacteriaceae bacterium]